MAIQELTQFGFMSDKSVMEIAQSHWKGLVPINMQPTVCSGIVSNYYNAIDSLAMEQAMCIRCMDCKRKVQLLMNCGDQQRVWAVLDNELRGSRQPLGFMT